MRGARTFSWCPLKNTRAAPKNLSILRQKNNNNKPLAAFPPSVRLKEHQTKHTSLIPTERLQYKKSLGRIFGAATPPGALVLLVGSRWCLVSSCVVCLCSGRWLVGPFRTIIMLFYLTRPQLALLKSLPCSDRRIGPEAGAL